MRVSSGRVRVRDSLLAQALDLCVQRVLLAPSLLHLPQQMRRVVAQRRFPDDVIHVQSAANHLQGAARDTPCS